MANQQTSDFLVVFNCWQCSKCKFFTPLESSKCNSCGQILHFNINEKVGNSNDISKNINGVLENKWQCTWCSVNNDAELKNCQICGQVHHIQQSIDQEPCPSNLNLSNVNQHVPFKSEKQETPEEDSNNNLLHPQNNVVDLSTLNHQFSNVVELESLSTIPQKLIYKEPIKLEICDESEIQLTSNYYPPLNYCTYDGALHDIDKPETQSTVIEHLIDKKMTIPEDLSNSSLPYPQHTLDAIRQLDENIASEIRPKLISELMTTRYEMDESSTSNNDIDTETIATDNLYYKYDDLASNTLPYPLHILDAIRESNENIASESRPMFIPKLIATSCEVNKSSTLNNTDVKTIADDLYLNKKEVKTFADNFENNLLFNSTLPYPLHILNAIKQPNENIASESSLTLIPEVMATSCAVDESSTLNNNVDTETIENSKNNMLNQSHILDEPVNSCDIPSQPISVQELSSLPIVIIDESSKHVLEESVDSEIKTGWNAELAINPEIKDSWQCRMCTLVNLLTTNQCEACDAAIPDTITTSAATNMKWPNTTPVNPLITSNSEEKNLGRNWQCQKCTFLNPGSEDNCQACKQMHTELVTNTLENVWKCAHCTLTNPIAFDNCELCSQLRPIHFKKKLIESKKTKLLNQYHIQNTLDSIWQCPSCTFANPANLKICKVCEHELTVTSIQITQTVSHKKSENKILLNHQLLQNTPENIWKCSNCTFENPSNSKICQVCQHSKLPELNKITDESTTVKKNTNQNMSNNNNQHFPNLWTCFNCTLKNPLNINKCQACEHNQTIEINDCNSPNNQIPLEIPKDMWQCPACTFLNSNHLKDCHICGQFRNFKIDIKKIKREAFKRNASYNKYIDLNKKSLVVNTKDFECMICLTECQKGDGVILRECLHEFCRECLANTIALSEDVEIKCPYVDEHYACSSPLQEREVRVLVSQQVYESHMARAVRKAEICMQDALHCKTNDCTGWCTFEGDVNHFWCPVCMKDNCINCQAIHKDENCKEYQDRLETESRTNEESKKTHEGLQEMLRKQEAMPCPTCKVILMKKSGCDSLQCPICKTDICWVTRGPRWGPGGRGDISGGCKCRINGVMCHPDCGNCH